MDATPFAPQSLVAYNGICYRVARIEADGRLRIYQRRRNWHYPGFAVVAASELTPWVDKAVKRSNATCQCCERQIEAKRGKIAHHGYERPHGWHAQTASCFGAMAAPWQVSRDRLGEMIKDALIPWHRRMALVFARLITEAGIRVPGPEVRRAKDDPLRVEGQRNTYTHCPPIGPEHREYTRYLRIARESAAQDANRSKRDLRYHTKRFDGWKPAKLHKAK